jgi:hypothetical protein
VGPKFRGKGVCAHAGNLCNGAQSGLEGGIAVVLLTVVLLYRPAARLLHGRAGTAIGVRRTLRSCRARYTLTRSISHSATISAEHPKATRFTSACRAARDCDPGAAGGRKACRMGL